MMKDYPPYDLNFIYRSSHSVVWELADKAGILEELRLNVTRMDFGDSPKKAEEALFRGEIDFISGNHVSPYVWLARGEPIVCIASPNNGVRNRVVSREPFQSLADFRSTGLRVADSNLISSDDGSVSHTRGNHLLDIAFAGFGDGAAEWVEMGETSDRDFRPNVIEAVKSGRADIAFLPRRADELAREAGLHFTDLPLLPMINGTTITTTYESLRQKEGLAERLTQAMVLTVHYARMNLEKAQQLLDTKMGRPYRERGGRATSVAHFPIKAYPTAEGITNAFELCCMQHEEVRGTNPIALWDMRYLKDLELSGFIDELVQEEPEAFRVSDDGIGVRMGDDD